MTHFRAAFIPAALALAACGHVPMFDLAAPALRSGPDYPVTRAQVDALPYAAIAVRIGSGSRGVIVLAKYDGEARHWISANRVVFVTRNGRLVRTAGLSRDLRFTGGDPLVAGPKVTAGPVKAVVDLSGPDEYNVGMELSYVAEGPERITILERPHDTIRVREHVRVAAWHWSADNYYWMDAAAGFVWKSRQAYCPQVDPVEIEVLKKPA